MICGIIGSNPYPISTSSNWKKVSTDSQREYTDFTMPTPAILRTFISTPRLSENKKKYYELDVYDNDGVNPYGRPIRHHYRVCVDGTRDHVIDKDSIPMPASCRDHLETLKVESAKLWAQRKKAHQSKADKGEHKNIGDQNVYK